MDTTLDTTTTLTTFEDFFSERGHRRVTGTSLIPTPGDPVLFTTSGMHPLTPYLEGRPHPLGRRLMNLQRCLRTTDLDEVGDPWHLTVFEMLGTWSLGDYDHPQSIRWGYELLTGGFGIDPRLLYVTVFGGDQEIGPDTGSIEVWERLGVPIELLGEDNWWSNGPTGLCGTDTEIFVWTGDSSPTGTPSTDDRWVEVWNHVGLRFFRYDDGSLRPLDPPNVDTGMGLERLLTVLQGKSSVYETDLFEPWRVRLGELWRPDQVPSRVLSDHLRSSIVVVGDGVRPSNTGRGYVLRRLIRRILTTLWRIDPSYTLTDLPPELIGSTLDHFHQDPVPVKDVLVGEERRFVSLLDRGRDRVRRMRRRGPLTESDFTFLFETHGLPRDLVETLLAELE
jgi:alanyl-tRNA synthetase